MCKTAHGRKHTTSPPPPLPLGRNQPMPPPPTVHFDIQFAPAGLGFVDERDVRSTSSGEQRQSLIMLIKAQLQARAWLSQHAWPAHCEKTKVHETITFLLVTLPNIHRF